MEISNNILAVVEPEIRPTEIKIDALAEEKLDESQNQNDESGEEPRYKQTSVIGTMHPIVLINGYQFQAGDIKSFELNLTAPIPICNLELLDRAGKFKVGSYPRDGDYFTILINSKNQETFKSIHMDFDISRCESPKEGNVGNAEFSISGYCKIPKLYSEDCVSLPSGSSLDHIEKIARDLKLGLATNIDKTDDNQTRIMAYEPYFDFIQSIVKSSYIGEESFQRWWVDPYYYLNYIDVNALFNSPNPPIEEFAASLSSVSSTTTPDAKSAKDAENGDNTEVPLMLTNHAMFMSQNSFVEAHEIINNSNLISATFGYAREIVIYDNNGDKKKQEFRVQPLSSKNLRELEEPLKGNRNDTRHTEQIKYKYMGRQEAGEDGLGNVHPNHAFSKMHAAQNSAEVAKMKLKVTLNSFNPSLYKFQKIPVLMYLTNPSEIAQNERIKGDKKDLGMDKDEPFDLGVAEDVQESERQPNQALDTFLSGYYLIEDIVYKTEGNKTTQVVTLLRREWPTRTENLINPPGLEGASDEEKAENIKKNSPEPTPEGLPTATPAPTPAPTPTPTPDVDLDIQIGFTITSSEENTNSVWASGNTYAKFGGTWTANKELDSVDDWEADLDDTIIGAGSGMTLKRDGTWVLDLSQTGSFGNGTYPLIITIKAEGKTFTNQTMVTVIEK